MESCDMKKLFVLFVFLISFISVNAADNVIESTGTLSYRKTTDFHSQWITVVKAPAGNERRFFPAFAPDGTPALCAGRFGKNEMPMARYIFGNGSSGTPALFDMSGAGEEKAFTAQVDFLFHRQHSRPLERVEISLDIVSADQKTVYHSSLYANGNIWNQNNFKIQQIDLTNQTKKPKTILWKTINAKLEKGAWYRLKLNVVRMNETSRSPITLKLALYEIEDKKSGGKDGKSIAEAVSKIMPNLGSRIQFSITEPALPPYVLYLNNISAASGLKKKSN